MARDKIKQKSDLQGFIILHNEFIETDILNGNEKLVFMALKRHLNNKDNTTFPSLATLAKYSRLSKPTVQRTLKALEDKGIIEIEHRRTDEKGNTSNLYIIHDYKSMWTVDDSKEIKQVIKQEQEQEAIKLLESMGYIVIKEKETTPDNATVKEDKAVVVKEKTISEDVEIKKEEPTSAPTKVTDVSNNQISSNENNIALAAKSQPLEKYPLNWIKQHFEYDIMLLDNPYHQKDIDSVMDILHTALNTTKETIRIAGEDKPTMVVIGKLMKLDFFDIKYVIDKFSKQTGRVKNPTAYMLTILYNAPEQHHLDISNLVQHNMYGTPEQLPTASSGEESKPIESIRERSKNQFNNFMQREVTQEKIDELERKLLQH